MALAGTALRPAASRGFVRQYALPAAGILVILLAWELYVRVFHVPHYLVPAPSLIAWTLVEEWPTIQRNVGRTLVEAVGGFVLGNGFAVVLAIVFVHSPAVQRVLYPVAVAIRTVPIIAIAPILVLLLGNGYAPKVVIAALISFFPTLVNMVRISSSAEGSTANRRQVFFKLRLPSSLPFLFSALKIATASCVIGAIVAEWVGADTGLGYLIIVATFEFRTGLLYATTAVGSFLALAFFLAVVALEKAVVRWKPATLPP